MQVAEKNQLKKNNRQRKAEVVESPKKVITYVKKISDDSFGNVGGRLFLRGTFLYQILNNLYSMGFIYYNLCLRFCTQFFTY